MRIFLKPEALNPYVESMFTSVPQFVDSWQACDPDGFRKASVIYDWIGSKGLPYQAETVLSFFGALALDPIATIDFEKSGLMENFSTVRAAFLLNKVRHDSVFRALAPLFRLYYPSCEWPNTDLVCRYYDSPWNTCDFTHSAGSKGTNDYAAVKIRLIAGTPKVTPIAFHVAYKHGTSKDDLWRPYGSIVHRLGSNLLFHENGFQQIESWSRFGSIAFETFFGPSPSMFRIASAHRFEIGPVEFPSRRKNLLRFPG